MRYLELCPEVAALGLGDNTVMDKSVHPPIVSHLHYEIDVWLGDDLLEAFPCFIVTKHLADALADAHLTGYELRDVEISTSDMFNELDSNIQLPPFVWLHVTGEPGQDDLGLTGNATLVVSERTMSVLRTMQIDNCETAAFQRTPKSGH
jgi:hypothetical protein